MIQTPRDHYEELLASRYTWLYGGFAQRVADSAEFFRAHGIAAPSAPASAGAGRAADLGAGSGFQSVALAQAGFAVDAVDLSPTLLQELTGHARSRGIAVTAPGDAAKSASPGEAASASVRTIEADLVEFLAGASPSAVAESYALLICMGDTLPHLQSFAAVEAFFEAAQQKLEVGGRLILGFRDLSGTLEGLDRFIPVQSDDTRIFTCFLEYESDEQVVVHDLIYERAASGNEWTFHKSCYYKLRIGRAWVTERLVRLGFRIAHEDMARGFITLIAERVA